MGKIVTVTVPIPTNGMTNDPRDRTPGVCRMASNFDIVTDTNRAVPYYDSEDANSNSTNDLMKNWCVALRTGTTYSIYGLGRQTALDRVRVFYKNISTGGSNDLGDNTWTETANNLGSTDTVNYELFVYYQRTGYIYGAVHSRYFFRYDPSGVGAFADTHFDTGSTFSHLAQGIVHSQDDILYVPYDNKIATNNNGTWNGTALTLPSEFYITSICEYGSFLAIAAAPLSGVGRSRVYLWNRASSLTTVSGNIDWGEGIIKVLEELQGDLVGISIANDATRQRERIVFRRYMGAPGARRFFEITATSTNLTIAKQKMNNRVFFLASATINGTPRHGLWSMSKNENTGVLVVTQERTPLNDTSIGAGPVLGFFIAGDYTFMAFINSVGNHTVYKTNNTNSYTATSYIETVINPNMPSNDWHQKKKVLSVGAMYDSLPPAGQVLVSARVDSTSAYTTLFTETTDSVTYTEPVTTPSGGNRLNDGKEFEFRLESTGGAIPTGFTYKYEVLGTNV